MISYHHIRNFTNYYDFVTVYTDFIIQISEFISIDGEPLKSFISPKTIHYEPKTADVMGT